MLEVLFNLVKAVDFHASMAAGEIQECVPCVVCDVTAEIRRNS